MPELPEVEIVRLDVLPFVKGRTVKSAEIIDPRIIKGMSVPQFKRRIAGQKILDIERRAKYLLFRLASGSYLVIHLGMTGRLLFAPDDYVKVIFNLSGNRVLYYSDARLFGKVRFYDRYPDLKLGPEPLADDFTADKFRQMLRQRKAAIKLVLLDQKFLSGLGNIYAIEALFRAGIHPRRKANSLNDKRVKKLHREIRRVLLEALGHRGTSDNWFRDARGRKGKFQFKLKVYGREGEACFRCRSKIKRIVMGQRGTYFCPGCQK